MFTGLIREVGEIVSIAGGDDGVRLASSPRDRRRPPRSGTRSPIDGVCLTVVAVDEGRIAFDAVPETLARSSLQTLEQGSRVNLEPALRAGDPLGGHYVQGHVDGVGTVRSVEPEGDGRRIWFDAEPC